MWLSIYKWRKVKLCKRDKTNSFTETDKILTLENCDKLYIYYVMPRATTINKLYRKL